MVFSLFMSCLVRDVKPVALAFCETCLDDNRTYQGQALETVLGLSHGISSAEIKPSSETASFAVWSLPGCLTGCWQAFGAAECLHQEASEHAVTCQPGKRGGPFSPLWSLCIS